MITRSTVLFLLLLLAGNAPAASFDCNKASSFAEKEICRDGYLSALDEMLTGQYKASYTQALDKQTLQQSQREWLTVRDQCTTQKCLDTTISERIHALKMYPIEERDRAERQAQAQYAAEQEQARRQEEARIAAEQERAALQQQSLLQEQARAAEQRRLAQERLAQQSTSQVQQSHNPSTASPYNSDNTTQSHGRSLLSRFFDSPAWKWTLLAMVLTTLTAMYLHHNGSATVYINYTDAVITNGLPLLGLIIYLLGSWLELPKVVTVLSLYGCIIAALAFALYTAFLANGFGAQFVLVLIAKITLISVFYALMALLLMSMMPTKFKDETRAQAEARNRRATRDAKIQIAALGVGYTFLTRWLCRYGEFAPVSETLSYTPSEA